MSVQARELWNSLGSEEGERAVVSAVFEEADDGLALRCASVIAGPAGIATLEVEERVADELVWAERLRLEDVDMREVNEQLYRKTQSAPGTPVITLVLPTLGRKCSSGVAGAAPLGAINTSACMV